MSTNPAQEWRPSCNPWPIAVAVMLATFLEVLDTSVANVALPHIAGNLSTSTEESTWVLTSYLVSNAIILPATGWLSRFFGRKRFLLACIFLFTFSSAVCGAATSLGMLVVARILQGAGGGALQPISQAVLLESFSPAQRGVAMAVFGMGIVVAPIIGPTLGGWITDNYSWRWAFYINLPIGILATFLVQALIEDPPYIKQAVRSRIDYVGFGLLALWLATLQVILDKGQQDDWFAAVWIRWCIGISAVSMIAFILWELCAKEPVVELRILTNRNFAVGSLLMMMVGAVLYSTTALLPLFLQTLMGYPALDSGLAVSPRGIGAVTAMVMIGRLTGLIDNRLLIVIGFAVVGFSSFLLGNFNLDIGMGSVVWPILFSGFGVACLFVPLTTVAMGMLRNEQLGNATGIFNLMRNIGGSIGIAAVTTLLARGAQVHQALMVPHLTPYDPAYQYCLHVTQETLAAQSGSVTAAQQAFGLLYNMLTQQARLWAFVDNFRLLGLLSLLCIPSVFFFKKVRLRGSSSALH